MYFLRISRIFPGNFHCFSIFKDFSGPKKQNRFNTLNELQKQISRIRYFRLWKTGKLSRNIKFEIFYDLLLHIPCAVLIHFKCINRYFNDAISHSNGVKQHTKMFKTLFFSHFQKIFPVSKATALCRLNANHSLPRINLICHTGSIKQIPVIWNIVFVIESKM